MTQAYEFLSTLPSGIVAGVVAIGGWLVAGLGRVGVAKALKLLRFNRLCERMGVSDFLRKGEVARTPAELAGRGVYWIVLLGSFIEAARLLDIKAVVALRERVVAAVPALLGGALVLAVGIMCVAFLATFVRTIARNAGSPYAVIWSRLTRWAGAILVLAVTIEQAETRNSSLAAVLHIALAALALGLALAFGLGCQHMARDAMQRWIADMKERLRESEKPDMEG